MRWIKLLIISFLILFLLLTTIAALLPSEVRISRAVDIQKPVEAIYPEIASLEKWAAWNLYIQKMDSPQFSSDSISGKDLRIRLIKNEKNQIVTEWEQLGGRKFNGGLNLIAHPSSTTVQWYFDFRFKWYPWEKFSSIVYDAQVGPAMETSLQNLKSVIENVH